MININRNQTFRFNCSKLEKEQLNEKIRQSGLHKNNYMMSLVLNDNQYKIREAAICACRISDQMNQLELNYPEIDFKPLRTEVDQLCQKL